MKTKIILLFAIFLINMTANSQTKKISVDKTSKNVFYNEYWSKGESFFSGVAMTYETYFFDENGTFTSSDGYSGGMYFEINCRGTYRYNPLKKEIKLRTKKCHSTIKKILKSRKSTQIFIKNLTDTTATIATSEESSDYTMSRRFGVTTDQYWNKGGGSSANSIYFYVFGQVEIRQEISPTLGQKYVCEYYIIDNYLLLEIKSMTTKERYKENQPELFSPFIRTYLKINIKEDYVEVENMDLSKTLDGKRNWTFQNMEYQIEDTNFDEITYVRYNRVKARKEK